MVPIAVVIGREVYGSRAMTIPKCFEARDRRGHSHHGMKVQQIIMPAGPAGTFLGYTGLYYLDREYAGAREARKALCRVMEDYDRQARPWLYPWLKGEGRPAVLRAKRAAKMILLPASQVIRVAA